MIKGFISKTWGYIVLFFAFIVWLLRIRSSIRKDAVKDIEQDLEKKEIEFNRKVQAHKDKINEKATNSSDDAKRDQLRKHSRTRNSN